MQQVASGDRTPDEHRRLPQTPPDPISTRLGGQAQLVAGAGQHNTQVASSGRPSTALARQTSEGDLLASASKKKHKKKMMKKKKKMEKKHKEWKKGKKHKKVSSLLYGNDDILDYPSSTMSSLTIIAFQRTPI